MAVSLQTNLAALRSQRALAENTANLGQVFDKLSSGLRINSASDDAAGLAIASALNTASRVYNQGVRNLSDGISLLAIAESGIEELSNIVIRIRELATQSANGILGPEQRRAIDKEAQQLSKEYLRITKTVEFNGQKLTDGSLQSLSIQAGFGQNGSVVSSLGGQLGTGTVTHKQEIDDESYNVHDLASGDLNGDGAMDFVSFAQIPPGFLTTEIIVHLGTGDGTFTTADRIPLTFNTGHFELGDLNNDGTLDIVASNLTNGPSVFLGNGDGHFNEAVNIGVPGADVRAIADINSDGKLDLIGSSVGGILLFEGRGDGSFDSPKTLIPNDSLDEIKTADLNGDGFSDLVTDGGRILLGAGDFSFSQSDSFATAGGLAIGDLNGDSNLDILSGSTVLLGNGDGKFRSVAGNGLTTNHSLASVALGDLNGDGFNDLVATGRILGYNAASTIFLGRGDGTFTQAQTWEVTYQDSGNALVIGDFNGDGVSDLVVGANRESYGPALEVYVGNSRSGVSPLLPFDLTTAAGARQAIPMLDRKLDQIGAQLGVIGAFQNRLTVAENNLQVSSEKYTEAESRIRDVDVAEEAAKMARLQVLQQASMAVLMQANQQPQIALALLGR